LPVVSAAKKEIIDKADSSPKAAAVAAVPKDPYKEMLKEQQKPTTSAPSPTPQSIQNAQASAVAKDKVAARKSIEAGNVPEVDKKRLSQVGGTPVTGPTATPTTAGAPSNVVTPATVLNGVLYPVLSKFLKQEKQNKPAVTALAQIKIAFDNAEKAKPGIANTILAEIVEAVKIILIY